MINNIVLGNKGIYKTTHQRPTSSLLYGDING